MLSWVTNSFSSARALREADRDYDRARAAAISLPLAEKIVELRDAKAVRDVAYQAAIVAA